MRRIAANYIFPVTSPPIKNGVITIDNSGKILNISKLNKETNKTEFYNGVIVPGFINTHCHLELSYLKGKFKQGGGLKKFLYQIVKHYRNNTVSEAEKIKSAIEADKEMFDNGIVSVGDVSNHDFSAEIKNKSKIFYHTFVEILDNFDKKTGEEKLENALKISKKFNSATIVPHSNYDVSCSMIKYLTQLSEQGKKLFSIHNQETDAENMMFQKKTGDIVEFFNELGFNFENFQATGKTSLQSNFTCMDGKHNILLVHNIFTTKEDLEFLKSKENDNVYFSFCPSSNLFIENKLPYFKQFAEFYDRCTVGTDSYASNTKFNILEELKKIPLPFTEKIKWATINGANSLKINELYGSIETGKNPGLNLITNFDFNNFELTEESRIIRLI